MPKSQRTSKPAPRKGKRNVQDTARTDPHLETLLDDALAATFPASDPVSTLALNDTPPAPSGPQARARDAGG